MNKVRVYVPFLLLLVLLVAVPALAAPGRPDFSAHVVVDGVEWGTKAVTALPINEKNHHSFDDLYVVTNGAAGQLLVGDSMPGERDYNGGRWATHTVTWNDGVTPVVLTSDAEIFMYESMGKLTVTDGSFEGGPPDYFECPLLPVLE